MAVVTSSLVSALRVGFQREFQDALSSAPSQWDRLSTRVPSSSAGNTYGWIGQFPKLREWSGDRSFKNIKEHGYSVMNNLYEATVDIPRTAVEDDDIGVYAPLFREMGYAAGTHPDEIVFGLLKNGVSGTCYDGKAFFAVDHPVYLNADGSGDAETVSNWLRPAAVDGTVTDGTPWFVLDVSRPLRPFIFQERTAPELQVITNPDNDYVFMKDKIPYGIRYRCNGGYGFWQQAVCSTQELNAANFAAALEAPGGTWYTEWEQYSDPNGGGGMRETTLCYILRGDQVLMLHRTKKKNDLNHDKWIRPPRRFRRAGPRRRQQYLVPRRDAAGQPLADLAERRHGRGFSCESALPWAPPHGVSRRRGGGVRLSRTRMGGLPPEAFLYGIRHA